MTIKTQTVHHELGDLDQATKKWSGIFEKVQQSDFNIIASPIIITSKRTKYFDYVVPIGQSKLVLVFARRLSERSFDVFLVKIHCNFQQLF